MDILERAFWGWQCCVEPSLVSTMRIGRRFKSRAGLRVYLLTVRLRCALGPAPVAGPFLRLNPLFFPLRTNPYRLALQLRNLAVCCNPF